jgi:protein tyrosine/serine phosphatase
MKDIAVRLRTKGEINSDLDNSNLDTKLNLDDGYKIPIFSFEYDEESIKMAIYLTIFKKPKDIDRAEFRKFKKEVLKHGVYRRKLWCLATKGVPIRLVVNKKEV